MNAMNAMNAMNEPTEGVVEHSYQPSKIPGCADFSTEFATKLRRWDAQSTNGSISSIYIYGSYINRNNTYISLIFLPYSILLICFLDFFLII